MARESLRVAVMAAVQVLGDAGVPSAQVDAELLAAHLLGIERTRLGLTPLVEGEWVERYREVISQRARRIPLQYLTGQAHLGSVTVEVGPGVFIPRMETEVLLAWAVQSLAQIQAPVVVDLCSGSGVIALAIAVARPDATVYAVERSAGALAWARRNADRHRAGGGTPIHIRGGDFTDERLLTDLDGVADLVTANPPYVPEGTKVEPEVADHDPHEAVFAGADGLDAIKPLISVAAGLLKPGGYLAIEHDDTHGDSVPALLSARRILADVTEHHDLAGRPRFVTAQRVRLQR
ncbi:peptide chain release factor N(5)-glutamine methyltransferase [Nakamurella antarctica]|uniref:Release factor glutamine methyltransferase n=1 Tax=Nakamurella antarctica TaxID=1902245 RepID=A0A3G8ZLF5_9ACTN|nr:peptide chain release factor N(5)-glutamine methyltransferase [Nakamurella antarctica]AZI58162.1 peptide chain release factor N(5)-glutamine methyltransferase [Nakamurella antarctica]